VRWVTQQLASRVKLAFSPYYLPQAFAGAFLRVALPGKIALGSALEETRLSVTCITDGPSGAA
jgi:hypothetical protein